MLNAGYRFRGYVACPLCGKPTGIYQIPNQFPVFTEEGAGTLHLEVRREALRHVEPPELCGKDAAAGPDL
jgi:hypothetical protein